MQFDVRSPYSWKPAAALAVGLSLAFTPALSLRAQERGADLLRAERNLAGLVQREISVRPPATVGLHEREESANWSLDALGLTDGEDRDALDADTLVDCMREWLYFRFGDAIDEFMELELDGSNLRVVGTAEVIAAVDEFLPAFAMTVAPRLQVKAWLVELPEAQATDPAAAARRPISVPVDELGGLLGQGTLRWQGSATTRAGQPVRIGSLRLRPFLRRYFGEVAQAAGGGYPILGAVRDGLDVVIEPHVLAGNEDLLCYMQGLYSKPEPLRDRPTGIDGHPALQVPDVATTSFATGYRQPRDAVACLWSVGAESDGSSFLLAVHVRRLQAPVALEGIDVLPLGSLSRQRLRNALAVGRRSSDDSVDPEYMFHALAGEDEAAVPAAGRNFDSIENALENDFGDLDDGRLAMFRCGTTIVLLGKKAERQNLVRSFQQLETVAHQPVELEFMTRAGSAEPAVVIHHLRAPGLAGRAHSFSRGRETTWITEYSVSIAQEYVFHQPVVRDVFHGFVASMRPWKSVQGVGVEASVEMFELGAATRRAGSGIVGGDMWQGSIERSVFRHDGPVRGVVDFGAGARRAGIAGEVLLRPALQVRAQVR